MNKVVKRVLIIAGITLGAIVLSAGGYAGYVLLSYSRIGDTPLKVDTSSKLEKVEVGTTYKALSYNIGFGAYSQDFTFFMDEGFDEKGNKTAGHDAWAKDTDTVLFNVNGAINTVKSSNADFVFFQEVDTDSTRARHINEDTMIKGSFTDYDHIYCCNYHAPFLPYPFYQMHGYASSGIITLSKYQVKEAERKEYAVSDSLSKILDLDRCFSSSKIEVSNGKSLYIVNSHMSAYDEGGKVRPVQVKQLKDFITSKRNNGDYVIVGGDWNHDLLVNSIDYAYTPTNKPYGVTLKNPPWLEYWYDENRVGLIEEGFHMYAADNIPTCRNNDIEWQPGKTFVCTVDGFLVSDNIDVTSITTIETKNGNKGLDGFAYSDHEPTVLEFKLKA